MHSIHSSSPFGTVSIKNTPDHIRLKITKRMCWYVQNLYIISNLTLHINLMDMIYDDSFMFKEWNSMQINYMFNINVL